MKFRATVFWVLFLLVAVSSVEALVLDAPHNRDNGIWCFHCHSVDPGTGEDFWFNDPVPVSQDNTRNNWVCYRCHGEVGDANVTIEDPNLRGPKKSLHSSSQFGAPTEGSWSTECTDCHDPHFQSQKYWVVEDGDSAFIATGTVDSVVFDGTDLYDPDSNPSGANGYTGITTIDVTVASTSIPVADWVTKGKGASHGDRGQDGTRGLIYVVDRNLPLTSRTYEIVGVSGSGPYTLKLKGKGDFIEDGGPGIPIIQVSQEFGILYGAGIRDVVKTPDGSGRIVKYYSPTKGGLSGLGGTVDLTPDDPNAPVGLCQVCHTNTEMFTNDPANDPIPDHHDSDGKECVDCHDILTGAEPDVDHGLIIVKDTLVCDDCHVGFYNDPDGGHLTGGCNTCHDTPTQDYPDLNATTLARAQAFNGSWVDTDGASNNSAIWTTTPLDCDDCHNASFGPAPKDYTTLVEHPVNLATAHNTKLANVPLCTTACHGAATPTEADIVTVVHSDNCMLCHVSIGDGGAVNPVLVAGITPGADCQGCHTGYFDGHTRGLATNHDASMIGTTGATNPTNCVGCHVTSGPAVGDAPTAINSPYTGAGEVHAPQGCNTCHALTDGTLDGQLKVGTSRGNGDATVAPGGDSKWECVECHSAFEVVHTTNAAINRSTSHPGASFSGGTDKTKSGTTCNTCHQDLTGTTASLNTWGGILREHSATDSCDVCHDYVNDPSFSDATPPLGDVDPAFLGTATCYTCHYANKVNIDHGGHLSTDWSGNAACNDCHPVGVLGVVEDVHNDDCALCHVNPGASDYNRKDGTGMDGNPQLMSGRSGDCLVCHEPGAYSEPFIHHDTVNADTTTLNNNCTLVCHTSSNNNHHGVHTATVVNESPCVSCHTSTANAGADGNVLVESAAGTMNHDYCTSCHGREVSGNVRLIMPATSPLVTAMPEGTAPIAGGTDGGGVCTNCHGDSFGGHTHSHVMTRTASCATTDCHDADGGTNARSTSAAPFVGSGDVHETINCSGCHDVGNDGGPVGSAVNWNGDAWGGSGSCTTCHNSGNFGTIHGGISAGNITTYHTASSKVTTSASCILCHDLDPGTNTTAPNAVNTPYLGAGEVHVSSGCDGCHTPATGVIKAGYGKATGMTSAGGTCEDCHTAAFFDSHTHTHDVALLGSDISYTDNQPCYNCHDDFNSDTFGPTALDTWPEIMMEHDRDGTKDNNGACVTCHQGANIIRTSGMDTANYSDILDVVQTGSAVHCINCHFDKKSPNVHGLIYVDHMVPNDEPSQAQFAFAPIINNTECNTCHPFDLTNSGTDLEDDTTDVIVGLHNNACGICHLSQPQLILSPNLDQFSELGTQNGNPDNSGVECVECHQTSNDPGFTKPFHGMTAAASAGVHNMLAGSTGTGATDCESCHPAGSFQTRIELHPTCETCHTEASTPATTAITSGIAGGTVNCETCHTYPVVKYRTHAVTAADADNDNLHGNIATDAGCTGCHTMTTEQQKLELHTGGCLQCHNATDWTGPPLVQASQIITDGRSGGGNSSQACVNCHDTNGSYLMHGLDDAGAAGVHSLNGSNSSQGIDCELCHVASTAETRLGLHADCAQCHSAGTPASTQIANLTAVGCEGCHTGPGIHTMHEMTEANVAGAHDKLIATSGFAGNDDCAVCHTMGTDLQRLTLHVTNGCTGCHTAGGTALAAINDGTSILAGGNNNPQNCASCHAVQGDYNLHGLTDASMTGAQSTGTHDKFIANAVVNSDCKLCHGPNSEIGRLQVHTALTPNDCRGCHNSADTATIAAISSGIGGTDVSCADCHNGANLLTDIWTSWDNHADPDHTSGNLNVLQDSAATGTPNIDNCESCHDSGSTLTQVQIHNGCYSCHHTDGLLKTSSNGFASAATNNYTSGNFECVQCHVGYPTNHTHHDNVNTNQVFFVEAEDRSQNTDNNANACYQCHEGGKTKGVDGLDDWNSIYVEHNSTCTICHNYTDAGAADGGGTPGDANLAAAIATAQNNTPPILADYVRCVTCHVPKDHTEPTSGHGGHDDTHFGWGADGCENCHGAGGATEAVVSVIHGDACGKCHNDGANATRDNNGIDATNTSQYGKDGDAVLAEGSATAGTPFDDTVYVCTTCHPIGTYDLSTVHHDSLEWSVTNPGSCTASCHVQGVSAAVSGDHDTTNYVNTHANCSTCHTATAANGFDMPVNADLKTHNTCQSCHNADANASLKAAGGLPLADANPIGGGTCDTCHADFTLHASHNHTTVGAQTDNSTITKNCQSCHSGGTTPFVTANVHTGCDSCHNAVTGALLNVTNGNATVADGGIATDGVLECGECHAAWFDGHKSHDNTTHAITTGSDTDGSSGTAYCSTCHKRGGTGSGNPFYDKDVWGGTDGIFALHQSSCVYCHDKTTGAKINFASSTYTDLQDAIQNGGGGLTCLDCHSDRGSGHAGHDATHFPWTPAMEQSCGGEGIVGTCHDSTVNTDVVNQVHDGDWALARGSKCILCHVAGTAGLVDQTGFYGDGDPRNANLTSGAPHNDPVKDICTSCHTRSKPEIHHNTLVDGAAGHSTDSANGLCENCHMDRRPAAKIAYSGGIGDYQVIKQKACRACHMQITSGSLEVLSIKYAKENSAEATGDDSGNTYTVVKVGNNSPRDGHAFTVNHTVPTNASVIDNTAIDNYGTCYYCHGETGSLNYMTNATKPGGTFSMDTPKMVPYHALPLAGAYNSGTGMANNTIGGAGWLEELGPAGAIAGGRFRGNMIYMPTLGDNSYYPVGKNRLNVGYAQHSLLNKAAQGFGGTNVSATTLLYDAQPAGLKFGKQIVRNDSATPYYVPHFDPVCNAGTGDPCDTVTITSAYSENRGFGWEFTANSSTGANLHVIFGGLDVATCASDANCVFVLSTTKGNKTEYGNSQFNYAGEAPAWVVSEDGGSALIDAAITTP